MVTGGLRRRAWHTAVLVAVAAGLLLPACSKARDELVVYSGRGQDLVKPLLERFARESGISIRVRYGDSANLALRLDQEGDRTDADVFLSQSPGTVGFLAAKGRLAGMDPALLDRVDARFRSARGTWVGVSGRQRVLVYNKDLVAEKDLPRSVFDLTDPRWAKKVGVAPANASFEDFVTSMRELVGDERTFAWLSAMARNDSPTYAQNAAIVDAVGRGEIPLGLVNHYYNFRALAEDPALPSRNATFRPGDPGSLILMSTVSVLRTSDRKDEAEKFVAFLLSYEAQTYFTQKDFEYPLVSGIPIRAGLPLLDTSSSPAIDLDELGGELKSTLTLIERSGLGK